MKIITEHHYSTEDVEAVNRQAQKDPAEFVRHCEEQYYEQLDAAAAEIVERLPNVRVVLLSGPSASGKTTTAEKLSQLLAKRQVHAGVVSLDDFYLGVGNCPKREDGSEDYETIYSLDIDHIHACLEALFKHSKADFPIFDFRQGRRTDRVKQISLGKNEIIILEGIHALNPILTETIPREALYRLYVSVRTKFVHESREVLIPKCTRLIRRVVRDFHYRGVPASISLGMWEEVCEGERVYINPYRDLADRKIDSTLDYEPCVFKGFLDSVVRPVAANDEGYELLEEMYAGLNEFQPLPPELIPKDSLLREFIAE